MPVTEYQNVVEALQEEIPQARAEAMKTRAVAEVRDQARAEAVKTRTVAGASDKAKTEAGRADTIISLAPSPLGGWERYREWGCPEPEVSEGVLPVVRQEVVVSFTVQADSTITDLKAEIHPVRHSHMRFTGCCWTDRNGCRQKRRKRMPELVVLKIVFK
ncbi:MAG: hypothetical protein IPI74_03605 [Bacteroidales bacterium]|nr:hypothetical protein [Bacteroidales bacterium]